MPPVPLMSVLLMTSADPGFHSQSLQEQREVVICAKFQGDSNVLAFDILIFWTNLIFNFPFPKFGSTVGTALILL